MIDLIIFSFCTACLAHFFQMTMEEDMIFEWYGKLLNKIPDFFAKPLGSCILCNGAWIFIIAFLLLTFILKINLILFSSYQSCENSSHVNLLIVLFLGIGVNYIWIRVIGKIISKEPEEKNISVRVDLSANKGNED